MKQRLKKATVILTLMIVLCMQNAMAADVVNQDFSSGDVNPLNAVNLANTADNSNIVKFTGFQGGGIFKNSESPVVTQVSGGVILTDVTGSDDSKMIILGADGLPDTTNNEFTWIEMNFGSPKNIKGFSFDFHKPGNAKTAIVAYSSADGNTWSSFVSFLEVDPPTGDWATINHPNAEATGAQFVRLYISKVSTATPGAISIDNIVITEKASTTDSTASNDTADAVYYTPLTVAAPGVLANDTLIGSDKLNISTALVGDQGGSVILAADGGYTYTQNSPTFTGSEVFTYEVVDDSGASLTPAVTATITITTAEKLPSTLTADNFSIERNNNLTTENVLLNDNIALPDTLDTITDGSTTENGTVSLLANGNFTYTPATNFKGVDTFTYTVNGIDATVSIVVYDPAFKTSLGGLISEGTNWADTAIPTYNEQGIIVSGVVATFANDNLQDINQMNLRIDEGAVLKPAFGNSPYDIDSSIVHINGGSFNSIDTSTRYLRLYETTQDTTITIDSGIFTTNAFQMFAPVEVYINSGELNLGAQTFKFKTADLAYTDFLTVSGGTVNLTLEIDTTELGAGSYSINFTENSNGSIDIAAHNDKSSALTYWTGLWDTDKLKYKGQSKSDLTTTRAPQDFNNFFIINDTTFALELDPTLTPVLGLEVTQTGSTLTWSVTDEIDIKEYHIINVTTNELINVVLAGELNYSYELESGVQVKLVVKDNSGLADTYYPTNGKVESVEYNLTAGWNLITIVGENADLSALKAVVGNQFWAWDGSAYEVVTNPEPTQAIWVYSPMASDATITVEKSDATIELIQGWNMVGPVNNCKTPETATFIYSWNNIYQEVIKNDDMLIRKVGYWIFSQ